MAGPARLLAIARSEWSIENGLHHCRDVTFGEDHSRLRSASAQQANAVLNNLGLGLIRLSGANNVVEVRQQLEYELGQVLAQHNIRRFVN